IALAERLMNLSPRAPRYRALLANILQNSVYVLPQREQAAERERRLNRALDLVSTAAARLPTNSSFQEEKALCLEGLGMMLFMRQSQLSLAEQYIRESLAIRIK